MPDFSSVTFSMRRSRVSARISAARSEGEQRDSASGGDNFRITAAKFRRAQRIGNAFFALSNSSF